MRIYTGKIKGQRLNLAKMHLANYCISLEKYSGRVEIQHAISQINAQFGIVPDDEVNNLVSDVTHFYECLSNQTVTSFDRTNYLKWTTVSSVKDAIDTLTKELSNLVTD